MKGYIHLLDPNYGAKIDDLDFLTRNNISKYRTMVGSLNWLITLGCYDIHYTTYTLACYMMISRVRHMHVILYVFAYLQQK